MGLRFKFNLVLLAVFLAGLAIAAYVSSTLLDRQAREQVLREARLVLQAAMAVRSYTVDKVRPYLLEQMDRQFLPQTVPAFAATETLNEFRRKYPNYGYKEATLNPTNPRDRPADWEADIIHSFRNQPARSEVTGERETPLGLMLYIAHPIRIDSPGCLQCHSTPNVAPPSMLKIYGPTNGFGWKLEEIVGAQIVTLPMSVALDNAERTFRSLMISLMAVLAAVFVALNLLLSWLILRPVALLSAAADRISTGDFTEPEFAVNGKDEVAVLASSFNRMRRSLEKAMQMLGA